MSLPPKVSMSFAVSAYVLVFYVEDQLLCSKDLIWLCMNVFSLLSLLCLVYFLV